MNESISCDVIRHKILFNKYWSVEFIEITWDNENNTMYKYEEHEYTE